MIPRKLFRVCVEGNIGSGKTTFLNFFSNRKNVHLCYEPLHKWRNFGKDNLLELMYKDPIRWSHLFQTYVQLTMLEQHLEECHKPTKLMERSLFSARYCFVENLHKTGKISDAEYGVYCRWYDMIVKVLDVDVDLIVYLRTDPKMLHERILKRHRQEERAISLEYLESLHQLHEDWLITKQTRCLSLPPVLVINANLPLSQMHSQYEKYEHKIIQDDLSLPPVLPVLEPCEIVTKMRPLTTEETKILFEKLNKYIGSNIEQLLVRSDGQFCFRYHNDRVYYVNEKLMSLTTTIPKDNIISLGTCFGKFTKSKKFRLHVTALDFMAPYAQYKIVLKQSAETSFLYGNHVLKSGLASITDNTPQYQGVIIYSSNNVPLGFGLSAKATAECKVADPMVIVAFHQADVGEYIRKEETLT